MRRNKVQGLRGLSFIFPGDKSFNTTTSKFLILCCITICLYETQGWTTLSLTRESRPINFSPQNRIGSSSQLLSKPSGVTLESNSIYDNVRWKRLAEILNRHKDDIVYNKRIALIGYSPICKLVAELGAESVMICDEETETTQVLLNSLFDKNHQDLNDCDTQEIYDRIKPIATEDLDGYESEVFVLTTTSIELTDEPFVNDVLRRTDAPIFMDRDFTDQLSYHTRIQEGANITLW